MLQPGSSDNAVAKNRRLIRAVQYVQQQWLPINQTLLERVRKGLCDGVYELDLDFLIADIKQDYGLLLTCLREVGLALKKELGVLPVYQDPFALIHVYGYQRLKTFLLSPKLLSSVHSLERSSVEQVARLQETYTSATAVEVLAKSLKRQPQLGFSSGLIRQLGEVLVSWNYPSVYNSALASKETDFNSALTAQLGFSAQDLSVGVLLSLGLHSTAQLIPNSSIVIPKSDDLDQILQEEVMHLCEVGETLAKACHSELYGETPTNWEKARTFISSKLGEGGIRIIQKQLEENMQGYLSAFPGQFDQVRNINPGAKSKTKTNQPFNGSIGSSAASAVQKLIEQIYSEMQPGIDKNAVAKIVKFVIPQAGFNAGCIMILDPINKELSPKVTIGNPKAARVLPIKLTNMQSGTSPLELAYQTTNLISETLLTSTHGYVSYIAGMLGENQKAGVLYLELKEACLDGIGPQSFSDFKVIRQALCDCLKLK